MAIGQRTRFRLLAALSGVLALIAAALGGLGALWAWAGTHPLPGEGSLGHVGITVIGLGAMFVALVLGLLSLYTGQRARAAKRSPETDAPAALPRR